MEKKKNGMYFLEIAPIIKNAPPEPVLYFSSVNLNMGALVKITLKKREILGIVISSNILKNKKTFLKKSEFSLKPIKSVVFENFLEKDFIKNAGKISDFFACSLGAALYSLIDKNLLLCNKTWESSDSQVSKFILVPNKSYIENFGESDTAAPKLVFWSGMSKKEFKKNIGLLNNGNKSLVVATSKFLPLINKNFGNVVIYDETAKSYKMKERPYLDFRKAAEIIANDLKIELDFQGDFLRTETYFNFFLHREKIIVLKNNKESKLKTREICLLELKNFSEIFTDVFRENILKSKGRAMLFINRRGYGSFVICYDCGKIIECANCSAPLKIHLSDNIGGAKRIFICHYCFNRNSVFDKCEFCGGFNLRALGIGSQKIEEEVKNMEKERIVLRLDSDMVKNKKEGEKILEKFLESENGILIATEMFFSFLKEGLKIENVGIVNVDGMLNIPDFRANEKVFLMVLKLMEFAKNNFAVQIRIKENNIFRYALKRNIMEFYERELGARKKFFYPPFSAVIKITKEAKNRDAALKEILELKEEIKSVAGICDISSFPSFIEKVKNKYRVNLLLKINSAEWPESHKNLLKFLKSLPLDFKIDVNPENLVN